MSSFSYLNEGQVWYLEYRLDEDEIVNEKELKKITEKKREGIVKTQSFEDENGKSIKYEVTSLLTLSELLTQEVTDKSYCAILHSIATTFNLLEEEKIDISTLILNDELIFYDNATKSIKFIFIPTDRYVSKITPRQIMLEFSQLIISRMEEVSNLVLGVNDYLANREFKFVEFNCLINSIIMSTKGSKTNGFTKREYDEELESEEKIVSSKQLLKQVTIQPQEEVLQTDLKKNNNSDNQFNNIEQADNKICRVGLPDEVDLPDSKVSINMSEQISKGKEVISKNVKGISENAVKIFKKSVGDIQKALDNLKNKNVNKEVNDQNLAQIPASNYDNMKIGRETYQEAIHFEVAQQKEEDRQRMEDMKNNFENNRIFNYQAINSVEGASGNQTVILDCSSGEVANGNSITTSNPYLVRQSTGERIYIDSNNFKLGRGRKFVDYYVGGNDTISKVHAYITSNAKDFFIVDNSSKNHTYLDGVKLEPVVQTVLSHMSKIRLAKEEFVFHLF